MLALNSGKPLERRDAGLDGKASMVCLGCIRILRVLGVDLVAEGLEIGDVGFVEVGDMGITTELRDRLAPEIFLMRDSGLLSIGPNLAKSTLGKGSSSSRGTGGGLCRPACRAAALHRRLDVGDDVFAGDASRCGRWP